ncbi:MAG: PQQ-binding-like beta-propeller repeat protein [Verrucomicrobia bacterium]|nr:PQQ-binding-like beta-propeller repeat protein [Verrucomicrobiota bacterium]
MRFKISIVSIQRIARRVFFMAGVYASSASASDWPQFLGPTRDGAYSGGNLAKQWPKNGPPVLWKKDVGQGFSGPIVADGKVILFHRVGAQERVECFDAEKGGSLWRFDYPTAYEDTFGFDEGPRGTPAIADGKVFTFGAEGALHCLDFATGKKVWSVDAKKQFKTAKGFFGIACSPLVEGNAVLLNLGGENGAGVAAFDRATGKLLWKATDDEAGYASPTAATLNGQRLALFFTRSGLVACEPASGKTVFQFPWRARMSASVNAATPLVIDDLIFLSASYNAGAALLRVKGASVEKLWSGDDILSNHYVTSVHRNGFLYGFDGRQEQGERLRCVELKTGKVRWSQEDLAAGTVTLAGDLLLVLTERGELIEVAAAPEAFKEVNRAQILSSGVRAYPALANGRLFARSKDKLVCVNLAGGAK